ncbi:anti-sigma factor family protein [Candidatus Uabimicrobium amorphum]|uniref:Uncharacterized protein n=1 Tax=Uabimicrobium amorphum TaxID=2596890 RepID=A0A5S9ILE2_UABAM|nr:zf-HC2 domain-containing protein [Candidatus Uabimicrobium amorphum]BBM83190.1 hypothetical protein UABAM_01541 [Candidatus Uabimicrobium amorphum]
MDCRQAKNKWLHYLNGEITKEDQHEVLNHISLCQHCRETLELAEWIFALRKRTTELSPNKKQKTHFTMGYRRQFLLAAMIVVTCFILLFDNSKEESSVKVLSIESSTTYISENEHRMTYYHYHLGEHNE